MSSPIKDRKLVQWTLGYLAFAWVLIEATGEFAGMFGWPGSVQRVVFVLTAFGLPAVLVVGWFHGEKGRQEFARTEIALLGVIAALGVTSAIAVAGRPDVPAPTTENPPADVESELEARRYVILPFDDDSNGTRSDLRLQDAFARWQGVEMVDRMRLEEELSTGTLDLPTLRSASALARRVGADRFVRAEMDRFGHNRRLHLELRDARTGEVLAGASLGLADGSSPHDTVFDRLAETLLLGAAGLLPDGEMPGTTSLPARIRFLQGMRAVWEWDLEAAGERLADAARLDPQYARADLWRGQIMHWQGQTGPDVLSLANRASSSSARLPARERRLAAALTHLERRQFADACDAYRSLTDEDGLAFAAWFGLGECRRRDDVVVPDSASPSGWRFRSSYHQAVLAYRTAFESQPSVHRGVAYRTFRRTMDLLITDTDQVQIGEAESGDRQFAAYPAILHDTLALIPVPLEPFMAGQPGTRPPTHWEAVEEQRRMFRDIAAGWVGVFGDDPNALEVYSLTLEMLGDPAALETLRAARSRAMDERQKRRLAIHETVLLVKFQTPDGLDDLRRARSLGDSLLRSLSGSANEDSSVAVVAALSGRVHLAARMAREAAGPEESIIPLPAAVTRPAAALLVYAAFGAPADSITEWERRVQSAIRNRVPPGDQDRARHHLLDRAASLAFPSQRLAVTPSLAPGTTYALLKAQSALLAGDRNGARRIFAEIQARAGQRRPADRTPDALFPEAWLATELGDTATAVAMLDSTLNAMRYFSPGALDAEARAGPLVRAMVLRADLANARGNAPEAARWAAAVAALWASADPPLQPVVERMRRMAETTPHLE